MLTEMKSGTPYRLGAHYDGEGTNFALFSKHATAVKLCLFNEDGSVEVSRMALPERTGAVWHGYVSGLKPGALYGYRVEGPFSPDQGHRFNPNKLLIDPYAREFSAPFKDSDAIFGYEPNSPYADLSFSTVDSAAYVPKSVVSHPDTFKLDAVTLERGWDGTLIYESHVKGTTIQNKAVPEALRGTYEGLASDAMLDHLNALGVTSIELLPTQALKSEGFLGAKGLVNYWGYNTIGFFAPEPRYFGPSGVMGFRRMVDRFHAAGIEVIMDVVYNHSAEGDQNGPTLSFRGIDNASYYRLVAGQPRFYVNDTGCGNTLDLTNQYVLRMVMDSLRFWVQAMGVDGFRFDLATTLAREHHGFDINGSFFDALRQDPVLASVKLIAEPWDIGPGGYQLGSFSPEFTEWNDRYRDTVRQFWRGNGHSAQDLGSALLGSADQFDTNGRRAWTSVNFAAAHDGFTLADTSRYLERHNLANGENNHDGHHANHSDNFGVEGETDDPKIVEARRRRSRNILATVLLSQGTPMILAGDEFGNSQGGNNNAYCQDNETTWLDWDDKDDELLAFTTALTNFRASHFVLHQTRFLHGATRSDGSPDVKWLDFDGSELNWRDPGLSSLCLKLRGCAECLDGDNSEDVVLLAFNREDKELTLEMPNPDRRVWVQEIDTDKDRQSSRVIAGSTTKVAAHSVAAFVLMPKANAS